MTAAIHTSNPRFAKRMWHMLGGEMIPVRRTGELRYTHPFFETSVRANDRRHDVPKVLLSRINRLLKMKAANDRNWKDASQL